MITYTVKFKRQGSWTFETLKGVKEDGINEGAQSRFFILQDDSRVELPVSCYFVFSKERYELITQIRHKKLRKLLDQEFQEYLPHQVLTNGPC